MKTRLLTSLVASFCLIAASYVSAENAPEVQMNLLPTGAMPKLGGYRPQRLVLSAEKPAELKKAPDLAAPLYGTMRFGGASYLVILDEPDGKPATLYVDANGNGDLTDDPATTWKANTLPGGRTQYTGGFKLPLKAGDAATLVSLGAYRFDKTDPQRAALKNVLMYYSDYALEGQITIGGAKYHAMLPDYSATGDFRGATPAPAGAAAGAAAGRLNNRLMIDLNSDGKFDSRSESFDITKPFNIKGTTWEIADIAAGGSFKLIKSTQTVAEIPLPPDHSVGKTITPFKATKMNGAEVNFPADYKGKIVMLDFWATWCGPCMMEVPGLVEAYKESHPKGMEILGISLDQPNAADKIKKVTGEKGMTWQQVYDGKFWEAEIAQKYGIHSIPAAYLVDGDSGEILAAGNSLRGEKLAETLQAALAKKAEKDKK